MNPFVVLLFALIMVLTILTISIIVKFLKSKELAKRNVQVQIQLDLAMLILVFVTSSTMFFIVREIVGPFEKTIALKIISFIGQCIFNSSFNCVISLQLIQLYSIFGLTAMNDWSE